MVLPVIQVHPTENIRLMVRFQNTNDKPLKYFGDPKHKRPTELRLVFFQDGEEILNEVLHSRVLAFPKGVRELRPGEYVDVPFVIPWLYGNSKPGLYEVRMLYHVGNQAWTVSEFGITPITINKPILWLDVTESKEAKPDEAFAPAGKSEQ